MSAYQPISLSPYLTRVLGSGSGTRLPVSDRRRRCRRRGGTQNVFRLHVLGPPQLVDRQGRSILSVLAHPRRIALLTYLALATEDGLEDRTRLVSIFWPDGDVRDSFTHLDRTLHGLRRSLTRSSVRGDENGRVGICRERVVTDVDLLYDALEGGDTARGTKLVRGPLLGSVDLPYLPEFMAWLEEQRASLDAAISAALPSIRGSERPDPAPSLARREPGTGESAVPFQRPNQGLAGATRRGSAFLQRLLRVS